MTLYLPEFDTELFPIHTSKFLYRVNADMLLFWGVKYETAKDLADLIEMDRKAYNEEWTAGEESQMHTCTRASIQAGYEDLPHVIREAGASVISFVVNNSKENVTILDNGIGPGQCVEVLYNTLNEDDKDRVKILGLDPSDKKLADADNRLGKIGVNYQLLPPCNDYNALEHIDKESVDIIMCIAGGTHHSMISPWGVYRDVLKPGGFLVLSDWDVDSWYPIMVYDMCMGHGDVYDGFTDSEWPNKDEFDEKFVNTFLDKRSLDSYRELAYPTDEKDLQAVRDMGAFWTSYGKLNIAKKIEKNDAIWIPEGHIDPKRKIKQATMAGFNANSPDIERILSERMEIDYKIKRDGQMKEGSLPFEANPHNIVPDSTLWNVVILQKPK